ncbi:MAG: hypothetical protein KBD16_00720 [Candidatus Pacebacteria bacterium]|nr:hypothetical protein [Candidatus Paceibacterota bacterium]
MIDPAILRRYVDEELFNQLKEDQLTMNRFEVSVKHQLSLVPIRFAFEAHNFLHFEQLVQRGVVFESGNVGRRIRKAQEKVQDSIVLIEEPLGFN